MKQFFLFILIFINYQVIQAQVTKKNHNDVLPTQEEIINDKYSLFSFDFKLNKVSSKDKQLNIQEQPLFIKSINISHYIIKDEMELTLGNTFYKNCKIYEYGYENKIDSITKEVYHELGFISNNKVIL